MIKFTKSYLN